MTDVDISFEFDFFAVSESSLIGLGRMLIDAAEIGAREANVEQISSLLGGYSPRVWNKNALPDRQFGIGGGFRSIHTSIVP